MTNNSQNKIERQTQSSDAAARNQLEGDQSPELTELLAKIARRIAESDDLDGEDAATTDNDQSLMAIRNNLQALKDQALEMRQDGSGDDQGGLDHGQASSADRLARIEEALGLLSAKADAADRTDAMSQTIADEQTQNPAHDEHVTASPENEIEMNTQTEMSTGAPNSIPPQKANAKTVSSESQTEWTNEAAEQLTTLCEDVGLAETPAAPDMLIGVDAAEAEADEAVNYVYLQPDSREIGQQWFERRFEDLARRLDKVVTDQVEPDSNGISALMEKFDLLESRLDVVLGENSANGGCLGDIELCIAEIANQLETTTSKLARIDDIDSRIAQISELIEEQRNGAGLDQGSPLDVASIANLVAESLAAQSPYGAVDSGAAPIGNAANVGELSQAIKDFMREHRSEGEHASAVLDTMQQTIIRVLDRMEALEAGSGRNAGSMGGGMHAAAPAAQPIEVAQAAPQQQQPVGQGSEAAAPAMVRPAAKSAPAKSATNDSEEQIAIDRLERAVGKLDEAGPAPKPARPAASVPPAQRSRADFIAAARQAAARANAPLPAEEEDEAPVADRSRFAAAARKAAAKVTRRKINDDDLEGGEIDATDDGFSLGGMEAGTRETTKKSGRSRILFAAIALVAVGLGATKLVMSLSPGAIPKQLQSNGLQQGSSLAGEKSEFAPKPQKVGDVAPPQTVPAGLVQKTATDQVTYQPAESTEGSPEGIAQNAALAPEENQQPAGSTISGGAESTSRQSLPPALIGPLSLRLAAANGDASAEFQVGSRFADGKGIQQDFDAAHKWYRRSAGRGFALAQYRLGTLYERGLGVAKDPHRARVWYERAAQQDNIKAMHNLAVLAAGSGSGKPDYETAARWFTEAAERGLADSQFNLAILYQNGLGVPMDESLAYKWFSLAASSGDKEAAKRQLDMASKLGKTKASKVDRQLRGWMRKPSSQMANDPHFAGQAWQRG